MGFSKSSSKREFIAIQAYLKKKKNLKESNVTPKGTREKEQRKPKLVEGKKS